VGYSTLAEFMDPEDLERLISVVQASMSASVLSRDGTVERFIGDAVLAAFGVATAHEDDPDRAVEAALTMLEDVGRRSVKIPGALQLRIGVNTGLVVSGERGPEGRAELYGDAVNVAARLQQGAGPGEILVAASVWRRVSDRYEADHVGLIKVKGREQPVDAYRIVGARTIAGRPKGPLIGRRDELALLELLWSSATKGSTHIVSLVGEPGVGKSRLLLEFPVREGALDIRVNCRSVGPFGPLLTVIERILGSRPQDLVELRKLTAPIDGVDEESSDLLGALMGISGGRIPGTIVDEHQKRKAFAAMWLLLQNASAKRSILITFDDIHAADSSSLDLLGFLLERMRGAALMIVLSHRPEFDRLERTNLRAGHTQLRLELLSADESVALAKGFLGVTELPSDLEGLLASRAEGNPFFIEELLKALLELGSLAVIDGKAVLARVDIEIPDTVQGTILARTDRLSAPARSLLQHAAVIGLSFSTDLLQRVMEGGHLEPLLDELSRTQLLLRQGPDRWTFAHSLIQEVIYDTLLISYRRELHRTVAEALEAMATSDDSSLELLAEHYARAAIPEKARHYAVSAGDFVSERLGFAEAKSRYQSALRLWGEGDEEGRLVLMMKLGQAAHLAGDTPVAKAAFVEAEAGWRALGNDAQAGAALATLGRLYWLTGDTEQAREVLGTATTLLTPDGPTPELLRALVWGSTLDLVVGRIQEAQSAAASGLEIAERLGQPGARSHLLTTLVSCQIHQGDLMALDQLRAGLEVAEGSGDAEAIGRAYINLATHLQWLSENREAITYARQGRERMRKLGASYLECMLEAVEAEALVDLGQYNEAEELAREILGPLRSSATTPGLVKSGGALTAALARRGKYEEARQSLNDTLPLARRLGGMEFLARTLTFEAELEHALGNSASAKQAAAEGVRVMLSTKSFAHWFWMLGTVARLVPPAVITPALGPLAALAGKHSRFDAGLVELEGILKKDALQLGKAAELYASLELPFEEARCRAQTEGG